MTKQMICIQCPKGCRMEVAIENGKAVEIKGNACPRGAAYAKQEIESPMRTLTTAVITKGLEMKMLPVRTSGPIPKSKLFEAMDAIKNIIVSGPVHMGDVVVNNFLNLNVNLVATRSLKNKTDK